MIAALAAAALLLGAAVRAHAALPALAAIVAGAGAFSWPASLAGSALGALALVLGRLVWRLLDDEG